MHEQVYSYLLIFLRFNLWKVSFNRKNLLNSGLGDILTKVLTVLWVWAMENNTSFITTQTNIFHVYKCIWVTLIGISCNGTFTACHNAVIISILVLFSKCLLQVLTLFHSSLMVYRLQFENSYKELCICRLSFRSRWFLTSLIFSSGPSPFV